MAVNATALNNTPEVKISLPMTDNVYFFRVQFCANLASILTLLTTIARRTLWQAGAKI